MTSRDFCYWLQGCFEILDPSGLSERQTKIIKNHLNMVFIHEIDPSMPDEDGKLSEAHNETFAPAEVGKPNKIPFHGVGNEMARC
jgi:hypothetical protein